MVLLDLLGRRWMLRVLWEFKNRGTMGFSELQERCAKMSPSVLSQRLRELQEMGLLEACEDGRYAVTGLGRGLERPLSVLNEWATVWAEAQRPSQADRSGGSRRIRSVKRRAS
jgi:DNA-binding HxlR family transcriptional regulator